MQSAVLVRCTLLGRYSPFCSQMGCEFAALVCWGTILLLGRGGCLLGCRSVIVIVQWWMHL